MLTHSEFRPLPLDRLSIFSKRLCYHLFRTIRGPLNKKLSVRISAAPGSSGEAAVGPYYVGPGSLRLFCGLTYFLTILCLKPNIIVLEIL